MAKRHIENANWRDITAVPWEQTALNGRVCHRKLTDDPLLGSYTGIIEVPNGFDSKKVLACTSEFQLFVLDGNLIFDDVKMHSGCFCYYHTDSPHGRWRSAGDTRPGQRLTARLHDGTLAVEVVKDEPHTLSLLD